MVIFLFRERSHASLCDAGRDWLLFARPFAKGRKLNKFIIPFIILPNGTPMYNLL